ncbi:MAG: hypothetical protein HYV23_02985 [Deltaproteobacteria bacterium]|nr:hypothetical protein [Deltaproteobacteria bacterium]
MPKRDASRALEKSGWTTLVNIERHVKILRADAKIEKAIGRNIISAALSTAANSALMISSGDIFRRGPGHLTAGPMDSFDSRFDAFWNEYDKTGAVFGMRTSEYLAWRYGAHPFVDYRIFALFEGENMRGYIIYFHDGGHCQIEDIIATKAGNNTSALLSSFIRFTRENSQADSIVIKMNRNSVNTVPLRQFGFLRRQDSQKFMALIPDSSSPLLSNAEKWFLTSGDKDV